MLRTYFDSASDSWVAVAGIMGISKLGATIRNSTANLLYAPNKNTSGMLIAFNTDNPSSYWMGLYKFELNSKPIMTKIAGSTTINNSNDVGTLVFSDTTLNKFILLF